MFWINFLSSIKKTFTWLKHHWQIPFLLVWTLLVWIVTRRNSDALVDVLKAKKVSYEGQIQELKKSHIKEILKRDKIIEKYNQTIDKIEKELEQENRKLDLEEKERIKEIVALSKGNPNVVRSKIEELLGLTYTD